MQIQFRFDTDQEKYVLLHNQYEHVSDNSTAVGAKRKALQAAKEKCVEAVAYGSKPTKILKLVREEAQKLEDKYFVAPGLRQIQNLKKRLSQTAKKESGLETVDDFMQYLKTLKIRDKDHYNSLADDELIILECGTTLDNKLFFSFSCKGKFFYYFFSFILF